MSLIKTKQNICVFSDCGQKNINKDKITCGKHPGPILFAKCAGDFIVDGDLKL